MKNEPLYRKVINMWLKIRESNFKSIPGIISLILFVLSLIGIFATEGPWRIVSFALLGLIVIVLFYEIFFELPSKVYVESQNRIAELLPLEKALIFQKDNPVKFLNARLDCLLASKQSSWVSSDLIITSRLPYGISVKKVHVILWIPKDAAHSKYDLQTNEGEAIGNITGEMGEQDLKIRINISDQILSKRLLSFVGKCNCDF